MRRAAALLVPLLLLPGGLADAGGLATVHFSYEWEAGLAPAWAPTSCVPPTLSCASPLVSALALHVDVRNLGEAELRDLVVTLVVPGAGSPLASRALPTDVVVRPGETAHLALETPALLPHPRLCVVVTAVSIEDGSTVRAAESCAAITSANVRLP